MPDNVIILRDAAKAWVTVAERPSNDGEIIIFSPYITGELINEIVAVSEDKSVLLITSLKAQSVIAGSLDLNLLRKLVEDGVKVFSHENLHAKLLVNGDDTIIGSQNFTTGGTFNLETSVQLELSNENRNILNNIINDALSDSVKLTANIIDEYEAECMKHRDLLERLHKNVKKIDQVVLKHLTTKRVLKEKAVSKRVEIPSQRRFPATLKKRIWKKEFRTKSDLPLDQYLSKFGVSQPLDTEEKHQHHKNWLRLHNRGFIFENSYDLIKISQKFNLIDEINLRGGDKIYKGSVMPILNLSTYQLFFAEIHQKQISKFSTRQLVRYAPSDWPFRDDWKVPWNHPKKTQNHSHVRNLAGHHPDESDCFANLSLSLDQFPSSGSKTFILHYFFDGISLRMVKKELIDPWQPNQPLTDLTEKQAFNELEKDITSIVLGSRSDIVDSSYPSRYFDIGSKLELGILMFNNQHPVITITEQK